jgi:dTDP-4-dehydrorhamnose reductase
MVFSGERARSSEDAPAEPLSVYGRTKLAGERAVLAADPGAAVARVALVLGRGHGARGSASESVLWGLGAGRRVLLFSDEYRTPIDAESVADAVARLLGRDSAAGLFHLGGRERLSRYELGLRTVRALGLDANGIVRASRQDVTGPEARPGDVSLDSSRARRELGWEPRPIDEALRESRPAPPR